MTVLRKMIPNIFLPLIAVPKKSHYTRPNFRGVLVVFMSNLVKLLQAHVFRIIFYQLMIIMGFILIMLWLKGWQGAVSAFAGAMSYALPTFLFLGLLSRFAGAQALSRFMIAFFVGEALKLIACGVLFLVFVQLFDMNLLSAFLGLSVSIVAFWIASPAALFKGSAK